MTISTRSLTHEHHGTLLKGYFACPSNATGPRPAILIAPAWAGCNHQAKDRAEILAGLGYAAFAIDLYGEGKTGQTRDECNHLMSQVASDRGFLLDRLRSTLEILSAQPEVDSSRIAAIGYCFGGLCVLDLARSGIDLRGVISFHGIFNPPAIPSVAPISAKVLVLHGFEDPMATPQQAEELGRELTDRGADWQIHLYGGTQHAFTNPEANDPDFGTVFQHISDARSWRLAQDFLTEVLK
jgi:dienelactone hydrolase